MATNATLQGFTNQAPGNTPWWTDAQAQGTYNSMDPVVGQNLPSALMGMSPQYAAALQSLGYTGGAPHDAQSNQQLTDWLNQNGYTSKTSFDNGGNQTSALFGANGQQAAGTQRSYGSDPGSNAFLYAMLAAGGFAGAAAAGVGAGAAAGGGDAAAGGGTGLAGTGLPEYSAYTGAGSGASAPLAGDATGTGIFGGGGAGATSGLSSADASALYGDAGYGGSAGGVSAGQAGAAGSSGLSGLSSSAPNSMYSDYAPTSGAGMGGAGQSISTDPVTAGYTTGSTTDPYSGGTGGNSFLDTAKGLFQNSSGTGLSDLGKSTVGMGIGALTGSLGGGNTGLLNNVNYQNAATAQGQSQRTNQSNAQGSLTYQQNGTDAQGNPTYAQNVSLNAPYQANLNSALSNQGSALGNLHDYNSGLNAAYANAPSLYGNAGSQAGLVKQAQDAAYNSQTSYLDPQYAQMQKQLQAQLANQGVTYGSDAYNAANTQFGSQMNQAYGTARDSAIAQGDTYANTLFNQNLAANQQYNTNLNNQGSNLLNQSSGALNGVVQNPTFAATPTIPTPYLSGAYYQGNANLNQYNANTGNANNLNNGLTGLAGAALGNSNFWSGLGNLFSGGG